MEYKNIFEIEFIQRTQEIVNGYQIPFENTLFINACVGLLIIICALYPFFLFCDQITKNRIL